MRTSAIIRDKQELISKLSAPGVVDQVPCFLRQTHSPAAFFRGLEHK